jgi:hypothetical protein
MHGEDLPCYPISTGFGGIGRFDGEMTCFFKKGSSAWTLCLGRTNNFLNQLNVFPFMPKHHP